MNRLLISEALEHAEQLETQFRDATEGTPLANTPSRTARIVRALVLALQQAEEEIARLRKNEGS